MKDTFRPSVELIKIVRSKFGSIELRIYSDGIINGLLQPSLFKGADAFFEEDVAKTIIAKCGSVHDMATTLSQLDPHLNFGDFLGRKKDTVHDVLETLRSHLHVYSHFHSNELFLHETNHTVFSYRDNKIYARCRYDMKRDKFKGNIGNALKDIYESSDDLYNDFGNLPSNIEFSHVDDKHSMCANTVMDLISTHWD